jgi:CubicO group peptidase (beta-lactamase class C family)
VLACAAVKVPPALLAALLAITACRDPAPAPATPRPPPTPPVDTSALDAYFKAHFPADQPGIAVLVARRGHTVFAAGYGLADLETREPITTRTLFNLGSLSKTFVASAILILQERGKLSVDDPLDRYFPAFKNPALAAKVQLRHLLTHTSGLPDNRPVDEQRDFYLTAKDAENWYPVTQADALDFEPGSRFAYSNPAFDALALVVEQLAGRPWQAFVRDELFLPAGMTTSTITDGPHPTTGVAHGYHRVDDTWQEADYGEVPTFAAAGNGGVWSSVEELALYERALRDGRFLRPETVTDARTIKTFPNWSSPEPPEVGWSWFIATLDGHREIGHTGGQGGFLTQYFIIPDADILIVFLMNAAAAPPADYKSVTAELRRWALTTHWPD